MSTSVTAYAAATAYDQGAGPETPEGTLAGSKMTIKERNDARYARIKARCLVDPEYKEHRREYARQTMAMRYDAEASKAKRAEPGAMATREKWYTANRERLKAMSRARYAAQKKAVEERAALEDEAEAAEDAAWLASSDRVAAAWDAARAVAL